MKFLDYLETHGVDTQKMEFKDSPKEIFNFLEAVNLGIKDILNESEFYNEILKDADIDFKKAVTIKDTKKSMELKELIQSYKKDVK